MSARIPSQSWTRGALCSLVCATWEKDRLIFSYVSKWCGWCIFFEAVLWNILVVEKDDLWLHYEKALNHIPKVLNPKQQFAIQPVLVFLFLAPGPNPFGFFQERISFHYGTGLVADGELWALSRGQFIQKLQLDKKGRELTNSPPDLPIAPSWAIWASAGWTRLRCTGQPLWMP